MCNTKGINMYHLIAEASKKTEKRKKIEAEYIRNKKVINPNYVQKVIGKSKQKELEAYS